jgi:hypothetical protein
MSLEFCPGELQDRDNLYFDEADSLLSPSNCQQMIMNHPENPKLSHSHIENFPKINFI